MNKQRIGKVFGWILCLCLTGCSFGEAEVLPTAFASAASAQTASAPPAEETEFAIATPADSEPLLPRSAASVQTTAPAGTAQPPTAVSVSPTPSPEPLVTPQAQAGVNIRHEGFGENAACVIVLDPGHQRVGMSEKEANSPATDVMKAKVTAGTQGVFTRIPECELTLAVALYARDALLAKGYTVIMTHETADVSISNQERTAMANDAHAAVLLHIHANGADNKNARGALTICSTRENPACGELCNESRRLAETLLDVYCARTGIRKEYVWETDTMTGINWSRVPAVTLEMGYMTNEEEDRLMASDAFRCAAADAIAQALDAHLHP